MRRPWEEGESKSQQVEVPIPKIQNLNFKAVAAAALSGILLMACFPKLHLAGVVWIAVAPLFWALVQTRTLKHAFLTGYVCGIFFFAGSCYWFVTVMEFYGHLAPVLAYLALILFVLIDSTFIGGLGIAVWWAGRKSPESALVAAPFLWVAMELARTYLITGFPWNLMGYGVQAEGIRQIASVTGVYGLSFLAAASAALLASIFVSPRWLRAGLAFAAFVGVLAILNWKLAPPPRVEGKELAILVQPNVPLDDSELEQWIPWRDPAQLQQLVNFSVSALNDAEAEDPARALARGTTGSPISDSSDPPLLVWAENPAPFFFTRDIIFRNAMENMARQTHSIVITNTIVPVDGTTDSITNTAITLDPAGREISRYDKIHLVPFGEYVPWWALPGVVHKITSEIGNFVPGTDYPVAAYGNARIGVFICYEAIVPQLARQLVAKGATVMVNISNDAWYGNSAAAYQHLEMARFRAIENHRYLLRATDNGVTTVIDPYGRVLQRLPRYPRAALAAHFDYEHEETFYTAHGDLFAWACGLAAVVFLAFGAMARTRN